MSFFRADIKRINDTAVFAKKTGMIILGGGVVKHHTCNANLMVFSLSLSLCVCAYIYVWALTLSVLEQRNGADFSVYINTGQEFDGSDSGARPDEAISWGKIRMTAQPVKVYAEATLVFPIIVAETFAKDFHREKEAKEKEKEKERSQ